MKQSSLRVMLPIYATSFAAWFYWLVFTPLAYIYQAFPGKENIVMLIAVLPGIFAMGGAFITPLLMKKHTGKTVIIGSLALMLLGAGMVRFFGDSSLFCSVIGSGLTGVVAGSIPTVNYTTLVKFAPNHLRDKVIGWSDGISAFGMMLTVFFSGFLSADGNWTRAFDVYGIVVPLLLIAILWYPSVKPDTTSEEKSMSHEKLPASVITLIILKFFTGLFSVTAVLQLSDLAINELKLCTSILVGTMGSISSLLSAMASLFIFLWLKTFKRYSASVALLLVAVSSLLMFASDSIVPVMAGYLIAGTAVHILHSCYTTVTPLAAGSGSTRAAGLVVGFTFVGEALCGYVPGIFAGMIFGSALPSQCLLTAGIACLALCILTYFVFGKVYAKAFDK